MKMEYKCQIYKKLKRLSLPWNWVDFKSRCFLTDKWKVGCKSLSLITLPTAQYRQASCSLSSSYRPNYTLSLLLIVVDIWKTFRIQHWMSMFILHSLLFRLDKLPHNTSITRCRVMTDHHIQLFKCQFWAWISLNFFVCPFCFYKFHLLILACGMMLL